jgi:hypothetical protein
MWTLIAVVLVVFPAIITGAEAWSVGDTVPVNVWIRINQTMPKSPNSIPLDFCPRFARPKIVQIPSIDYGSHETDVAIRFEIGRGLNRQTKWMALKQVPTATNYVKQEKHLTMVVFRFGFQLGSVGRFTSFQAFATYSEKPHETITIHYEWDEHRAYNPHIALTVVSIVSLVLMVLLMHRISSDTLFRSKSKGIQKISVVRDRTE